MAKYEVLIKAVTVQKLSYAEVARRYGVSETLVHKLHHRWLQEGDAAFEPRSRRPHSSPNRTPPEVRDRVLALRDQLTTAGLDAGADTITELLTRQRITISRATVWRILTAAGRVRSQPQKRPRSSWNRFTADRPNELWQSDFTHVLLTDGGVGIDRTMSRGATHGGLNSFAYSACNAMASAGSAIRRRWSPRYRVLK